MTGVTLPVAINSPKMVRSSWFTFAMKKTIFWLTNRDNKSAPSKRARRRYTGLSSGAPTMTSIPLGFKTRLHADNEWFPTLRSCARLRWEPLVISVQARLESQGDTGHGWRTGREPGVPSSGSFAWSAFIITVREPEDGLFHCESEPRGSDHLGRVNGDRESNAGHRQALQVE